MFLSLNVIEKYLIKVLDYVIPVIEILGALIILASIVCWVIYAFKKTKNSRAVLGMGISLGLEILMCSEVLRTIITRSKEELIHLGVIVIIRIALAVLTQWEVKNELENEKKENSDKVVTSKEKKKEVSTK